MIHIAEAMGCDADLCIVSLEDAEEKLLEATKEKPIGIIVSSVDRKMVREVVNSKVNWKDLEVTILDLLPLDMWILYNKIDAIYSDGA